MAAAAAAGAKHGWRGGEEMVRNADEKPTIWLFE